jgi:outer membrane receptor protein involved in Fe transport
MHIKVVTSSKVEEQLAEAPSIMSVVPRKEIETYGANSLFDVLDRVTSLYIYGSYFLPNNMITVRGEATSHYCTHVLLMINGRPFHSSLEGYDLPFINAFPLELIERIEIIRGPGSTLYGSTAYAGAINVITQAPAEQKTTASAGGGSFGTTLASLATGFTKGDLGVTLGTSCSYSDGWIHRVRDATADSLYPLFEGPARERALGVHGQLNYKKIKLNAFVGHTFQMNGAQLRYIHDWPELNLGLTHATVDLGYATSLGNWYRFSANATYNFQHMWQPYDINARDVREYGFNNDVILEMTNHFSPVNRLLLTLGGLAAVNNGSISNNLQLSDGTAYDVWRNPANPDPFRVVPDFTETRLSAYLNAAYTISRGFKAVAGAHVNKVGDLAADVVPRLGLVGTLAEHFSYKVLYGQAYRSPDFFERFSRVTVIEGSPGLKPERITTLELQTAYTTADMTVALTGFYSGQRNLINRRNVDTIVTDSAPLAVAQRYVNEGRTRTRGVELESKCNLGEHVTLNSSISYQENEDQAGLSDRFGVPNLFVKLGASYSRPTFGLGLFASRFEYLDEVTGYTVPYPDANPPAASFNYVTLHATLNWKRLLALSAATPRVCTELYLVNLLNEEIYYPEIGRRIVNSTPGRPGFALYGRLRIQL